MNNLKSVSLTTIFHVDEVLGASDENRRDGFTQISHVRDTADEAIMEVHSNKSITQQIIFEETDEEHPSILYCHKSSPLTVLSEFKEVECGEPLKAQHLVLDFTPVAGVDNETMEKKCSDFWTHIYSRPELKDLLAMPEVSNKKTVSFDLSGDEGNDNDQILSLERATNKTAMDWLKEKGFPDLLKTAFKSRDKKEDCKPCYPETEYERSLNKSHTGTRTSKSRCSTVTKKLCEQMEAWDKQHLRSFAPPGPVISLKHAEMIRKSI